MSVLHLKDYRPLAPKPESAPSEASASAKRRKQLHNGFAATVAIGLALASLYVGGRIVSARRAPRVASAVIRVAPLGQPAVATKPSNEPVAPAPAAVSRAAKPKTSNASPSWNIVNPRPGEMYLQVAAIPARTIDPFLVQLEAKGFRPVIAPCPTDGLYRILLGPYSRPETRADTQTALAAAGFQSMVRVY